MNRDETLDTAKQLINGDRQQTYGSARDDFTRTGNLWQQILGVPVTPEQVAICMTLLKIGRLCTTPGHEDSWVDGIGYLALGSEIATQPVGDGVTDDTAALQESIDHPYKGSYRDSKCPDDCSMRGATHTHVTPYGAYDVYESKPTKGTK